MYYTNSNHSDWPRYHLLIGQFSKWHFGPEKKTQLYPKGKDLLFSTANMPRSSPQDGDLVWQHKTKTGFQQNVYIMYHSTENWENAESILDEGFRNSNGSESKLGTGIYVTRSLEKAIQYGPITFKLLVYPGLTKKIRSSDDPMLKTWQRSYGCAWVPPTFLAL